MSNTIQISGKAFRGSSQAEAESGAAISSVCSAAAIVVLNWNKTKTIDLSSLQDDHEQLGADLIRESRCGKSSRCGQKIDTTKVAVRHRKEDTISSQHAAKSVTGQHKGRKEQTSHSLSRPVLSNVSAAPANHLVPAARQGSVSDDTHKLHSHMQRPPTSHQFTRASHASEKSNIPNNKLLRPANEASSRTASLTLASAKWLAEEKRKVRVITHSLTLYPLMFHILHSNCCIACLLM